MLKTFPIGGIHPPDNKLSAGKVIEELPIPERVMIPLQQHLGSPATAVVKKGDKVLAGQIIATASGFVSANIHSSVSGTVEKIDTIQDIGGFNREAVFIKVEGDEWIDGINQNYDKNSFPEKNEIVKKISDAGIVGMGGAAFPTHVKITIPEGKKAEILLINGVECEPYLTADHRLMLEQPEALIDGIKLLMKAIGVEKAAIGIENNKADAISLLEDKLKGENKINVVPLKVKYPQGGEKQLVKAIVGHEITYKHLPIDFGVVVVNVGTLYAIHEAVRKNIPLVKRVVTVTGKSLKEPKNLMVRIGTPVSKLIDFAGGIPEDTSKIIGGGPMMGKALISAEASVTKATSGILLLSEKESHRKEVENCIRCGRCITVCAFGLEPYLLSRMVEKEMFEEAHNNHVLACCECGSCSYICPAGRPLLDYLRLGKNSVNKMLRAKK